MITEFNKYKQKPKIRHYNNGKKLTEEYFLNGIYHREDGPAYQSWYNNDQKRSEQYYLNGKRHREDGPAGQHWHDNGQKLSEYYYLDGKYHREDGTAAQRWYENGQIESKYYYLNNIKYSKEEWLEKLKEINSIHYEDELIKYNAEKYNI